MVSTILISGWGGAKRVGGVSPRRASTAATALVLPEFFQSLGVGAPEVGECGEGGKRLGTEVMFDVLHFVLDGLGFEAHEGEQFGEGAVAVLDVGSDLTSLFGERESAVTLVVHEAATCEPPDHVGNGGSAETEGFGEVGDPRVADAFDEFLDPFEVILGGFGAGIACNAGGPWHVESMGVKRAGRRGCWRMRTEILGWEIVFKVKHIL